jgi:hypothetical protein
MSCEVSSVPRWQVATKISPFYMYRGNVHMRQRNAGGEGTALA